MKAVKCALVGGWVGAVCLFFWAQAPAVLFAQNENHCFTCHTNPRRLIEITREIAQVDPKKPGASAETRGEG
jgi:hypothetical protein